MRLDIKPLSVNQAWKGRRHRSHLYNSYTHDILILLNDFEVPEGELELYLKFGFSSAGSDFDNPIKPFVDCLQQRYGFNDNRIKRCVVDVEKVKKGKEFIEWNLKPLKFVD